MVKITPEGWEVIENKGEVIFQRYPDTFPLPRPETTQKEGINRIDRFVRLEGRKLLLYKIFLLSTLIPDIEYPVPCFYGEKRSGKGTIARLTFKLIDPMPSMADGDRMPQKSDDIIVGLEKRHLFLSPIILLKHHDKY